MVLYKCLKWSAVCNDLADCEDGSDEDMCTPRLKDYLNGSVWPAVVKFHGPTGIQLTRLVPHLSPQH